METKKAACLLPFVGGGRDSNPRHSEPQSDALPAELRPPFFGGAKITQHLILCNYFLKKIAVFRLIDGFSDKK
jgi:hypothetical protein